MVVWRLLVDFVACWFCHFVQGACSFFGLFNGAYSLRSLVCTCLYILTCWFPALFHFWSIQFLTFNKKIINPDRRLNFGPTISKERLGHMNEDNTSSKIMWIVQCIWEVNERMFVRVLRRVYHCVIMNANLFWNVHRSIMKDLLLCYKEY
jgi:hypothetical protein